MFSNILLNTDSYKASHYPQYPKHTQFVSSYIEARGGQFEQVLFFGLQAFLKQYLTKPITFDEVDEAEQVLMAHGVPFYRQGWDWILMQHGGYLPVEIQAIAEGRVLPTGNALVQIQNTDPAAYWLTSYLETALLRAVWYPSTVATLSWHTKQIIQHYLDETSDDPETQLPFKLHDFGARGASSQESAALGGMAHLVNFQGTDTVSALLAAKRYYHANMAGFSIPASEHSTMTAWGKDHEAAAYANMLKEFGQEGAVFAVVSDSYDIYHAVSNIWGKQLREQVEKSGATLVVRPDSGKPEVVVLEVLERLFAEFGGHINHKGYKVLADCVRVIQGDGVNLASIELILQRMKAAGFAADNIAFGMGGGLLQKVDRDTLGFAMKASAVKVNDQWRDVFKQPATDTAKHSKKGRLAVINTQQGIQTIRENQLVGQSNRLRTVFKNGRLLIDDNLDVIRKRSTQA